MTGNEIFVLEELSLAAASENLDPKDYSFYKILENETIFIATWLPKSIHQLLKLGISTLPDYKVLEITGTKDGAVVRGRCYIESTWD